MLRSPPPTHLAGSLASRSPPIPQVPNPSPSLPRGTHPPIQRPGERLRRLGAILCFLLALTSPTPHPASAQPQPNRAPDPLSADVDALCRLGPRALGTAGYDPTVEHLRARIATLPNVQLQVHAYPVLVPVTRRAVLELPAGGTVAVHPFWPAHVRLNATLPEGVRGRLVYVGDARPEQIPPGRLRGQIAVVEASAGDRWTQAAYFGARAVLVLGTNRTTHVDLRSHDLAVPIDIPRFYVPPGPSCDALRAGQVDGDVTLKAQVNWERRLAKNLYAFVPARQPIPDGWTDPKPPGALAISVPLEATGLVPDLAVGASQAVQTAAGLALLEDFARRPAARPVLVCFQGADGIQFLGTRNLFMALNDVPRSRAAPLTDLADKRARAAADLRRVREIAADPKRIDVTRDRDAVDRIVKLIETDAADDQDALFRIRRLPTEDETPDLTARRQALEDRQVRLNALRFAFQQHPDRLVGDDARAYVDRTAAHLETLIAEYDGRKQDLDRRVELYRWLADLLGKDPDPSDRTNDARLIEALVALDLSDRGIRVGPMYFGWFQRASNISQVQNFRDRWTTLDRAARNNDPTAAWFGPIRQYVDLEPLTGSRAPATWLCAPLAIGSEMCPAWGVPGFTLLTLDDLRLHRDTPADTRDNLDLPAIAPQLDAVRTLLRRSWDDLAFRGDVEFKPQRATFGGQVVSPAPGRPVPDLPRPGFLVGYHYVSSAVKKVPQVRQLPWTLGVRRNEIVPCTADGEWLVEGLPRLNATGDSVPMQLFSTEVYRVQPDTGAITGASDLGKQSEGISTYADVRQDVTPIRNLVFDCSELSLVGCHDPRFLQDLGEVLPLDARRNAEPQRYFALLSRGLLSAYVEPDTRIYLLLRYGRVGNRLVLLNMPDPAAAAGTPRAAGGETVSSMARGYSIPDVNHLGAPSLATAADFHRVDAVRLAEYRRAGVSSTLLDQLHARAGDQIDRARDAVHSDDGPGVVKNANGAWANEARVYQAAQDMANDVVYAAIFLLLLCVPFSFCMERLLIATPNVYRQIAGMAGIFAVMTAALWSFHPAFKISMSPLIIILAFAILFMSIAVIAVVYGKFDTELKRIRSGRGTADAASFARSSVLLSAVLLGIANMRRRKFRTLLTSTTVVLITFAVLCFTSATRYLDTTTLPTGVEASHPGILLRQRGFRQMPPAVVDNVRAVLGPDVKLVERWWNVSAADPKEQVNVIAFGEGKIERANGRTGEPARGRDVGMPRVFTAAAVLGLSPGESTLASNVDEVIGKAKFARLEAGEERIVYLSKPIAGQLRVTEGDAVRVGGIDLRVAGVFDPLEFDRRVTLLSGEPISPLQYSAGMLDAGGRQMSDTAAESLDLDASGSAAELSSTYEHLSSSQFIIVPAAVSRLLPNASLRSIGLRLADYDRVKAVSDELSKRLSIALFAGYPDGVRMVAASSLAAVSGAGQVAVPLAVAGLIIFNTMMGSIAERRREIHVYTSLGLAPLHVGALFVAEALTYGLVGAVFGYVIGQGVGTLFLKLGWLGNVTLNYSGTSAILTMGLVLLVVLLSALVPARLASKIAAPSIERTWKVPLPKGDEILATLPFTINKTAAEGALAYLAEFFDNHREGSIGKFSSANVEPFAFEDEHGRPSRGLKTVVWLTPFDLGVRQHLLLLIHPGEFPDIYEVQVVLQRLSGDDGSWYRMNRTFLTELRKQFLQWRSLSPARMLEYVDESKRLFGAEAVGRV